jgi:hypothetical protein
MIWVSKLLIHRHRYRVAAFAIEVRHVLSRARRDINHASGYGREN